MATESSKTSLVKDSFVAGENSEGVVFRGNIIRLNRLSVVFEMYNPQAVLRFSEALGGFNIVVRDKQLYSGKAVVRNLMNTGSAVVVCEATLNENSWGSLDNSRFNGTSHNWGREYKTFLAEWQQLYKVRPEYKLALADMVTYLADFRIWLEQLELGMRAYPTEKKLEMEKLLVAELTEESAPAMNTLFDQFETIAQGVGPEFLPAHYAFARRQLIPLISCSPFFYRCFFKPLGYAGDYEMVNMMLRHPCEGTSLFAKVLNTWFLAQPPVVAHRNRIDYLVRKLLESSLQNATTTTKRRIMTVGCGPAQEIQKFLTEYPISSQCDFTLLDFNEETLRYTESIMSDLKARHGRAASFNYIKKSVHHILKEGGRNKIEPPGGVFYDFVYCAGLFDYLSDQVCKRLMEVMYDWLAPGGLLVATNVAAHNPSRGWMEHVTDWYLIYRDSQDMRNLIPKQANPESARVLAEASTVNIFVEVEKASHA